MHQETGRDFYYRQKLNESFVLRKSRRSSYSLRGFARDLDILAPTLSSVMKGHRSLPFVLAIKVSDRLELDKTSRELFLESVIEEKKIKPQRRVKKRVLQRALSLKDELHEEVLSTPLYFSVLSFLRLDIPSKTPSDVARFFGITESRASFIIERLYRLGMLKFEKGQLVLAAEAFKTSDEKPSLAIRNAHKETLKLAARSLDNVPLEMRDFCSLRVPLNKRSIAKVKKEVRLLLERVYQMCASETDKDEVYEFSVQFFPQTVLSDQRGACEE